MEKARGKKYSVSYHLVASPGASGFVTIHRVQPGMIFKIMRIEVFFPTGVSDELEISFWYGNRKVFPDEGVLVGDNIKYDKEVDLCYYSGDLVKVYYRNLNTTYERICDIVLEGELE